MGYRSEVALCLSPNVEIPDEVEAAMKAIDCRHVGNCRGSRLFVCHSVKWYTTDPENYPEIHTIDAFINAIEFDDCFFIRLGEDWDDLERRGGYYDNPFMLGIFRELSYDSINDTL